MEPRFFLFSFLLFYRRTSEWYMLRCKQPQPIIDDRRKAVEGKEARKQTENQVGEIM